MRYGYVLLLILIAIASAIIMYPNNHLNYSFDDLNYYHYAVQQYYGTFNPLQSPYAFGYLLPLPIMISFHLFGFSLLAASLPFMIMYVMLIILIYLICTKLFNGLISFTTALMASFTAFIVGYSPRLLPDMPIGLAVAFALYFLLSKAQTKAFLAGLFAGLIFYIKIGAALIIPIFLIGLLMIKSNRKTLYFLIGVVLIAFIYFGLLGFNFNIIPSYSAQQSGNRNQTDIYSNIYEMMYIMPVGYTFYTSRASIQIFPLGLLFLLGIIGGIISIYKRNIKVLYAFLLFMGVYLYLFLGTESLHSYISITVEARYMIWIAAPIALCSAYCINEIFNYIQKTWGRRYSYISLMLIVTLAFISNLPSLILFASHQYWFLGAPI